MLPSVLHGSVNLHQYIRIGDTACSTMKLDALELAPKLGACGSVEVYQTTNISDVNVRMLVCGVGCSGVNTFFLLRRNQTAFQIECDQSWGCLSAVTNCLRKLSNVVGMGKCARGLKSLKTRTRRAVCGLSSPPLWILHLLEPHGAQEEITVE